MQNRYYLLLLLSLIGSLAWAQPKINSPITHWGIGESILNQGHHLEMMGGLYGGYNNPSLVNVVNPAALGYLRLTAFDVALSAGQSQLDAEGVNQTTTNGSLHHLTLAFPLRNSIGEVLERKSRETSWAMAFDLRSNTRVGYDVTQSDSTEAGRIQRVYSGNGGTYNFGWINAYRYKNFSFGADIGVLFGNIESTREIFFTDIQNPANIQLNDDYALNAFRWKLGAQYQYQLNPKEENESRKRYLVAGVYGNSNSNINTNGTSYYFSRRLVGGIQDTVLNEAEIDGDGVYPGQFGLGVTYQPNLKWQVGFNMELNNWGAFESDVLDLGTFQNGFKIGLGASYIPDANAFGNYFKRVQYRGGLQYSEDGRVSQGEAVNSLKATLGMTMPFYYLRQFSYVHLGLEYIRTDAASLIENYYGVTLGVTFNDNQWFLKRKFN